MIFYSYKHLLTVNIHDGRWLCTENVHDFSFLCVCLHKYIIYIPDIFIWLRCCVYLYEYMYPIFLYDFFVAFTYIRILRLSQIFVLKWRQNHACLSSIFYLDEDKIMNAWQKCSIPTVINYLAIINCKPKIICKESECFACGFQHQLIIWNFEIKWLLKEPKRDKIIFKHLNTRENSDAATMDGFHYLMDSVFYGNVNSDVCIYLFVSILELKRYWSGLFLSHYPPGECSAAIWFQEAKSQVWQLC